MSNKISSGELAKLIVRHQQTTYAYIYSQLPDRVVAEDVLQETFVTVCEKYDHFEQGTNFNAWIRSIAFWKIRQAKASYVRSKLVFTDALSSILDAEFSEYADESARRHEALDQCLGKLKENDRRFVLRRYKNGSGVEEAANEAGRSIQAAYKALARIRQRLMLCIERELSGEGVAYER